MAKQKFEITGFTNGIVGSVSETDIPQDAASFSKNINAISEDGALRGINSDTVASDAAGFKTPSKHKQTLAINYGTNTATVVAIDSIETGVGGTSSQINTSSDHGLVSGDIIKLTGTVGDSASYYDGYYVITLIDSNSFTISVDWDEFTDEFDDGTFVAVKHGAYFDYSSTYFTLETLKKAGATTSELKYYFWFKQGTDTDASDTSSTATVTINNNSALVEDTHNVEVTTADSTIITATASTVTTDYDTNNPTFDIVPNATATIIGNASLDDENATSFILRNTDGSAVSFTTDPTLNFGDVTAKTGDVAATATIIGNASLDDEDGTNMILTNADGSTVTFHTDPTKNFGDTSSDGGDHTWIVNTRDISGGSEGRKATQAFWIACKAAIDAGELDMTITPSTFAGTETSFVLTHSTTGDSGNTSITLVTGVTADGETAFTGGLHRWRVNTRDVSGGSEVRKATQAFWIACKGAIDAGDLDMTIAPTSFAGTEEEFTLTQTTSGAAGNTAITLVTGITADGETNFTGGNDDTAENLRSCLNANSKLSATRSGNVVTITQAVAGSFGNTSIVLTDPDSIGMTKTNFSGGASDSDPGLNNVDLEDYTGVPIALDTTSGVLTTATIAGLINTQINGQNGVSSSVNDNDITLEASTEGKCDLVIIQDIPANYFIDNNSQTLTLYSEAITPAIVTQGYGSLITSDDMVLINEDKKVFNLFGIDYSANKIFKWENIYNSEGYGSMGDMEQEIVHDDVSSFNKRNKNVHLGLGNGETFATKWIGKIDRAQFNNEYDDWFIENDRLDSIPESLASLNFDIITSNQIHDNKIAFSEEQSYHADMPNLSGGTLQAAFTGAGGALFTLGTGTRDPNTLGKDDNAVPGIGWCFKVTDVAHESSDNKLLAAKKLYYENDTDGSGNTALAVGDIFMVVDNTPASVVLEYIGNTATGVPAFFFGATEGSTYIHKVSTSYDTDADATFPTARNIAINLSEILGESPITSIAPCRSPLTSGYTAENSSYICYGDGTIDRSHLGDQRCRALHMVYWIGTEDGSLYRINLMDFHSAHSSDAYKGPKKDALMTLDYSNIGKCQDSTYDGTFSHWYGPIYNVKTFGAGHEWYTSDSTDHSASAFSGVNWHLNYSWSRDPINSNITGIIETWNNAAETPMDCARNNNAARYVYDDDSGMKQDTALEHYPTAGYMDHHHAKKHQNVAFEDFVADKTVNITQNSNNNKNHGVDVGNVITGFIASDGKGHANYVGNTVCNKVRGIDSFQVQATHPASSGDQDYFPYYSCKVWVLFKRKDNTPFKRWDLMLYNFYPTTVQENSVKVFDRTPPYDETDTSTVNQAPGGGADSWWDGGSNVCQAIIQKSTMVLGASNGLQPQNSNYGGGYVDWTPYHYGILRRDGSSMAGKINQQTLGNINFGSHIGWDGSGTLSNVRNINPVSNTLTYVSSPEENPSGKSIALLATNPSDSDKWNLTANKHQVCFIARVSGKSAYSSYGAYDRKTAGTDHLDRHSGEFTSYSDSDGGTLTYIRVTDSGSAPNDTRTWAAHYEGDDADNAGINQIVPWHYADGGRFKKRCTINSGGTPQAIIGSAKVGSDNKLWKTVSVTSSNSSYDGTRLVDDYTPFTNTSSNSMYQGQIGDYLYIDRKWLSSEPQVGTTHIFENSTSSRCIAHNNARYAWITGNFRMYDTSSWGAAQSINIRGSEGYRHIQGNSTGNNNLDSDDIPDSNNSNHYMASREKQEMCVVWGVDEISSSAANGIEYAISNHSANAFNNYGTGNDRVDASGTCWDINRFPTAWEIIGRHAFEMRKIDQGSVGGAFDVVRSMQAIYNNNLTKDAQLFISASVNRGGEYESILTTYDHLNNNTETDIPAYYNQYHYFLKEAVQNAVSTDYTTNSKIVPRFLVPNEDISGGSAYGHIWANGSVKPSASGAGSSQVNFICPIDSYGYDFANTHFDAFLNQTSDGYTKQDSLITVSDITTGVGSEFPASANIKYKVSLLYDGYQESPLSPFFYDFTNAGSDAEYVNVTLSIKNASLFNKRVTHIIVYRKNTNNDLYRMVKQISTKPDDWSYTDGLYTFKFRDDKRFASYSALTGINESIENTSINYAISAQINDSLFVGLAYHPDVEDLTEKYIFKSKPGNFSQFDYTKDYLVLDSVPVALASFNGKIYAFDRNNMYRINPEQMYVEDTFEGIGCLSQDALIVTEFGMCFADTNNIYLHDGSSARPIGNNILSVSTYEGWDIGWLKAVELSETHGNPPFVFYDGKSNSFICFLLGSCDHQCSVTVSRAWVYNISRNRWDYWESPKVVKAIQGMDGDVLLSDGSMIWNYRNDTTLRDWDFLSKKLSMTKVTNDKRFHRINMLGNPTLDTLSTVPKWNDDLVVYVDGEIQPLEIMNGKYTKSFSGCFLNEDLADDETDITVVGLNGGTIGGVLPPIGTYIMIESEIMLVTGSDTSTNVLTVTRAQLGTTAAAITETNDSVEGIEGQRVFNISPTIKLPAKCKGKNIEVHLQNQKGVVDSIMIDFIDKGTL